VIDKHNQVFVMGMATVILQERFHIPVERSQAIEADIVEVLLKLFDLVKQDD